MESSENQLVMNLWQPGMTLYHRCGLGGLACTLRAMEDDAEHLPKKKLPGKWKNGPPWTITEDTITLNVGKDPVGFVRKLLDYGIQITKDGYIFMPGQWNDRQSMGGKRSAAAAAISDAYLRVFLGHNKHRTVAQRKIITQSEKMDKDLPDINFKEVKEIRVFDRVLNEWEKSNGKKNGKVPKLLYSSGFFLGAATKHTQFPQTTLTDPPELVVPMMFSMMGSSAIKLDTIKEDGSFEKVNMGVAIVPDVNNLETFVDQRPDATPKTPSECRCVSRYDAVLDFYAKIKAEEVLEDVSSDDIPSERCYVVKINAPGKSAPSKCSQDEFDYQEYKGAVAQYQHHVMNQLKPVYKPKKEDGFYLEMLRPEIRGIVAENLYNHVPWYMDVGGLLSKPKRYVDQDLKGVLNTMSLALSPELDESLIEAAQEQMRLLNGRIWEENKHNPSAAYRRMDKKADECKRRFLQVKTAQTFLDPLDWFFSPLSTRRNKKLTADVSKLIRKDWRAAKSAILLGINTYRSTKNEKEGE